MRGTLRRKMHLTQFFEEKLLVGHLRTYGATLSVLHSESLTLFVQKGKRQKLRKEHVLCPERVWCSTTHDLTQRQTTEIAIIVRLCPERVWHSTTENVPNPIFRSQTINEMR